MQITSQDILCSGEQTGSINLSVSGGIAPYTYDWNNGANTQNIQGLTAGTYSVIVSDANACTTTIETVINSNTPLVLSFDKTEVSCAQAADGSINLNITGGTNPYTIQWSNGSTSEDINNLIAGTYTALVSDQNNCTTEITITIDEPTILALNINTVNVACNGGSDGSIDLSIEGGTPPYTIAWSNGATTEDLDGLIAGNYNVLVTDAHACETTMDVSINQAGSLALMINSTDVACNGAQTGSVQLTIEGGMPPYMIQWNNGATTASISNIAAGDYSVVVTDANACETTAIVTINQATAISVTANTSNISCNNENDGSIDLVIQGGTIPYTILWNNGATGSNLSQLAAGTYAAVITDANGCTSEINQLIISEPSLLNVAISSTDLSCQNQQNGTASALATGGTAPYTYAWNTGANTTSIDGLTAGNYSVVITDANACTTSASITINQPDAINLSLAIEDVNCHGGNDGNIDLTVSGGTAPYSYAWDNGANTEDINNLMAGDYGVTVIDAQGCSAEIMGTVATPLAINSQAYILAYIVNAGTSTGAVSVNVDGGTAPYTYLWNNGATSQTIDSLPAGDYQVVITDANGCTQVANINLLDAAKIGNRVWEDTNGNGIQEQGENGLIGVSVKLTGTDNQGNLFTLVTTTNGLGEYCFDGLLAGDYSLRFTLPDGYVFTKAFLGGDNTLDSDANPVDGKTGVITLSSGTINLDVDAGVYRPGKIGDFVWEDANADGIQDSNELGLNQIAISLTGTTNAGDPISLNTISGQNPTNPNENGYYSFDNLAPGNYTITFDVNSSYNPSPLDQTSEDKDSDVNVSNTTNTINVISGTNDDSVDAGFFRGGKIGNLVWEDFNRDGIQDTTDIGVIGVVANLIDLGADGEIGGGDDALVNVISTSSDGTYCFTDILPGRYAVRFKPNSLPDGYKFTLKDQTNDNADSDADPLTGYTDPITVSSGEYNLSFDAGIVTICDDLSFGGLIGDDESSCTSFDPAEIVEINTASGGTGIISYQWYQTVLTNPTMPVDLTEWTLIQAANGINYDPATIDTTTHYIRAAKREGCTNFAVVSNIVTKTISMVNLNVTTDLTNERCAGSLISFIAYSSATNITVTWSFYDSNNDSSLLLDQLIGEEVDFTYVKSGEKLIRVVVEDATSGCSETQDILITILSITDPACGILPFAPAFTGFEARVVNQEYVQLNWTINEGDNFENFELERSPNGEIFETIAAVFGQNLVTAYDYLDRSPFIGRNFYRIKYIRLDGTLFYSDAVSAIIDSKIDANIFPNPTQNFSNINFTNTIRENSILEVVNAYGQVMETKSLPSGTTYIQVDLTSYQPGMYYIYLQTNTRKNLIQQILKVSN